jgi:tRNA modification GTPase
MDPDASPAPELAAEEVRLAARALASITGAVDVEDVLGEIFSSFCIGK